MASNIKKILVTGGAGFIGSSLIPVLLSKGYQVTAVDHLLSNRNGNLIPFLSSDNFEFIQIDLLDFNKLRDVVNQSDLIYHLASNVEVRKGQFDTEIDFLNNIVVTRNVLESMRISDKCKKIIFTSSSVVYGEPSSIPTSENYGPLKPISLYGATKLACEALISGYVGMFSIDAVIFRLANIVGPTSGHGVIFDFFNKLNKSGPGYLEVLGDGTQKKSYLYIDDCVDALIIGLNELKGVEIFNVGSHDQIDVESIARIVLTQLGLEREIRYVSETEDGRGWTGDVPYMLLSTDKLRKIGWKINYSSKDSVSLTVKKIAEKDRRSE
jgi:UDP-glucose 4-epimerase